MRHYKTHEEKAAYDKRWHQKNDPGSGVIGLTYTLAPDAQNPMWTISANLEPLCAVVGPLLAKRLSEKEHKAQQLGLMLIPEDEV